MLLAELTEDLRSSRAMPARTSASKGSPQVDLSSAKILVADADRQCDASVARVLQRRVADVSIPAVEPHGQHPGSGTYVAFEDRVAGVVQSLVHGQDRHVHSVRIFRPTML